MTSTMRAFLHGESTVRDRRHSRAGLSGRRQRSGRSQRARIRQTTHGDMWKLRCGRMKTLDAEAHPARRPKICSIRRCSPRNSQMWRKLPASPPKSRNTVTGAAMGGGAWGVAKYVRGRAVTNVASPCIGGRHRAGSLPAGRRAGQPPKLPDMCIGSAFQHPRSLSVGLPFRWRASRHGRCAVKGPHS